MNSSLSSCLSSCDDIFFTSEAKNVGQILSEDGSFGPDISNTLGKQIKGYLGWVEEPGGPMMKGMDQEVIIIKPH